MSASEHDRRSELPSAVVLHVWSECVFSGLDTPDPLEGNPEGLDDDALAMRGNQSPGGVDRYHGVQSYGIFVRAGLKEGFPSPGMACNGR